MTDASRLRLYYVATLIAGVGRGSVVVVMAWTALTVGGTMAAVGQIFIVGHLFNVFLGPAFGGLIDRRSRRQCIIVGQLGHAAAMAWPALIAAAGAALTMPHLYIMAIASAAALLVSGSALEGLLQSMVGVDDRRRVSATVGGIRQGAMVAGAGGIGFVIDHFGSEIAFLVATFAACGTASCVWFLPDSNPESQGRGYAAYWTDLKAGVAFSLRHSDIVVIGLAVGLSFSAGQLANALLPAFIRDDIGGASDLYGIVDAAWSVGGIASALLIAEALKRSPLRLAEFWSLAGLGLATTIFGLLHAPLHLVLAHAAMGAGFSMTKVLCDGRLLQICPENMIGRARTQVQALTSLFGLLMYLSPTLLPTNSARPLYIGWGLVIVMAGAAFLFLQARRPAAEPGKG